MTDPRLPDPINRARCAVCESGFSEQEWNWRHSIKDETDASGEGEVHAKCCPECAQKSGHPRTQIDSPRTQIDAATFDEEDAIHEAGDEEEMNSECNECGATIRYGWDTDETDSRDFCSDRCARAFYFDPDDYS